MVRHSASNYTHQGVSGHRKNFFSNNEELEGNFLRKLPDHITKAVPPWSGAGRRRLQLPGLERDRERQWGRQFQQNQGVASARKNICSRCYLPVLKVMILTFRVFVNTNLTSFKSWLNAALLYISRLSKCRHSNKILDSVTLLSTDDGLVSLNSVMPALPEDNCM